MTEPRGLRRWLSVAPMVDRSDRHFRVMMRAITRETLLYTEMISVSAALGPRAERVLAFDPEERPLALQLGGDEPTRLAQATERATVAGYDEVDLNCGCPSARVQAGRFGVVLMKDPLRVAACVRAMRSATSLPVTVKHRLGVDDLDRYDDVRRFVEQVAEAGADRFIVHARKAWLKGLSPKQNREVPPLRPAWVHRLKAEFPSLLIEINGGIDGLASALPHLRDGLDGVMIGRAAYDDPMIFAGADEVSRALDRGIRPTLREPPTPGERISVVRSLEPAMRRVVERGDRLSSFVRHVLGLVQGLPGARRFRRQAIEGTRSADAPVEVVMDALSRLEMAVTQADDQLGPSTRNRRRLPA